MAKPSFSDVIAAMEKWNPTKSIFSTGVFKPGVWEHTPLDKVLEKIEK